jgi:hypothetical protein
MMGFQTVGGALAQKPSAIDRRFAQPIAELKPPTGNEKSVEKSILCVAPALEIRQFDNALLKNTTYGGVGRESVILSTKACIGFASCIPPCGQRGKMACPNANNRRQSLQHVGDGAI